MKFKEINKKIKGENLNKIEHNKIKNNIHGITLIALVVTIIVLIILAGVSINLVLGENGLIEKAKLAKEKTEQAQIDEEEQLDELVEYIDTLGEGRAIADVKALGYVNVKTIVKDTSGNKFVLPKGFKIAEDSGDNVTEGIVIEDNDIIDGIGNNRGNQYVWIPVSNINTNGSNKIIKQNEDGTTSEIEITLGRYVFADGTNHKDEEGNVLEIGTPILKQNADNYADETEIHVTEIDPTSTSDYGYKELKDNRPGVASSGFDGENATATDLKGFIDSVKANGGYYIARYEASYGIDGKVNSKVSNSFHNSFTAPATRTEGMLWNNITQINAATASRNLYTTVNSDLINSYTWDTAIVYIQEFSGNTDYSRQDGLSIKSSLTNTGANEDELCKINDIASNTREWTTEYSTNTTSTNPGPCTRRGGYCGSSNPYVSSRDSRDSSYTSMNFTFRSALYL